MSNEEKETKSKAKSGTENTEDNNYYDVDELAAELGIDAAVLAGVKVFGNWNKGKKVTKKQLEDTVKSFLDGTC